MSAAFEVLCCFERGEHHLEPAAALPAYSAHAPRHPHRPGARRRGDGGADPAHPRRQRDGHLLPALRRGRRHDPAGRSPLGRVVRARGCGRHRAQRRPGPGRADRRGGGGVVTAGARRRHRRVRGARRDQRRALLRHDPRRRAPDHRRVAGEQCPGARRPGLRQRLLARGPHPRPAGRVARHPRPRRRRRARPGRRLRRPRCRPARAGAGPNDGLDGQRRRGRRAHRGARDARGHRGGRHPPAPGCRDDRPRRAARLRGARARPDRVPARPPAAPGRHQRRRRHPHRGAARRAGGGGLVGPRRRAGERRRSDQGDPAGAGHRTDPGRDRRLPRRTGARPAATEPAASGSCGSRGRWPSAAPRPARPWSSSTARARRACGPAP